MWQVLYWNGPPIVCGDQNSRLNTAQASTMYYCINTKLPGCGLNQDRDHCVTTVNSQAPRADGEVRSAQLAYSVCMWYRCYKGIMNSPRGLHNGLFERCDVWLFQLSVLETM